MTPPQRIVVRRFCKDTFSRRFDFGFPGRQQIQFIGNGIIHHGHFRSRIEEKVQGP